MRDERVTCETKLALSLVWQRGVDGAMAKEMGKQAKKVVFLVICTFLIEEGVTALQRC
jgi:hypothetical protein